MASISFRHVKKTYPGGADAAGEEDLKAHARKPQGQVGPGEQQRAVKHGATFFQNTTSALHYMDVSGRVGQKGNPCLAPAAGV